MVLFVKNCLYKDKDISASHTLPARRHRNLGGSTGRTADPSWLKEFSILYNVKENI